MTGLTQADYQHLLQLRTGLRRFLRWSEQQSRGAGITPTQHQLLLAVRGHPDPAGPTVGDVADYLQLRHHSAVGLIDRAATAGLVQRNADASSNATIRLALTSRGADKLEALTALHREELANLTTTMRALWDALERPDGTPPHPAAKPATRTRSSAADDGGPSGAVLC